MYVYIYIHVCATHQEMHYSTGRNDWVGFAPILPAKTGSMILKPADLSTTKKCHVKHVLSWKSWFTPRKINMEPENTPLEKENHLPNHHFQVPCWSSGVYHLFSCFAEVPNFQTSFRTIPIQNIKKKQIWQHSPSYKKTKLHWRILRGVFFRVVWITIGTRL